MSQNICGIASGPPSTRSAAPVGTDTAMYKIAPFGALVGRSEPDMQGTIVLKQLKGSRPLQILKQATASCFPERDQSLQGTATCLGVWNSKQTLATPGAHVDRLIVQGPKVHHIIIAFLCQQIWCDLQPASTSAMNTRSCIQPAHSTFLAVHMRGLHSSSN